MLRVRTTHRRSPERNDEHDDTTTYVSETAVLCDISISDTHERKLKMFVTMSCCYEIHDAGSVPNEALSRSSDQFLSGSIHVRGRDVSEAKPFKLTDLSRFATIFLEQAWDEVDVLSSINQDSDRYRRYRVVRVHPSRWSDQHDAASILMVIKCLP